MKLLYCEACEDIRSIQPEKKERTLCSCEASWGRYLNDRNVIVYGDHAAILELPDRHFEPAADRHFRNPRNKELDPVPVFFVPMTSTAVTRPIRCPCKEQLIEAASGEVTPCPCGNFAVDISATFGMDCVRILSWKGSNESE